MKEKFRKSISLLLIVLLLLLYAVYPVASYAQEVTPTDTPTPDGSQTTIDNNATDTNTSNTTSDTGDNTINPTPTPTIDPLAPTDTPTDTPTPTPSVDPLVAPTDSPIDPSLNPDNSSSDSSSTNIQNDANVSNNSSSDANSGENTAIATDSAHLNDDSRGNSDNSCKVPNGGGNITTGDAVSVTNVDNAINSASINSQLVYQTINLFVDSNGDINLSDPYTIAAAVIPQHPNDSTINVNVTNVNNYAYLNNNVVSYANTGNNTINGASQGAEGIINTGDAYSLVNLLNKVNFTIINSTVHIITINIFGNLNGNIILPDFNPTDSTCTTCGMSLNASNSATVTNNVDSKAISGQNTLNGSGSIVTGDANSVVNLLNLINSNFFGVNINGLFINVLGTWDGSFIGWGDMAAQSGGASVNLYETGPPGTSGSSTCSSCTGNVNITNNAIVENNVTSEANTGGNTINGKGNITTGNAFSLVSIINFINTNFINSSGFFGFLNIFGNWTGNIGGKSNFAALTYQDDSGPSPQAETTSSNTQEQGGQLSVTNSNNVGQFVNPGDTVTFFVKVKNTGSGKVYQTKLDLYLIRDGKYVGGTSFDLGDIEPGKGKSITTGFVLSKNAGGLYIARAQASGKVGPDDSGVSATTDSYFTVSENTIATTTNNKTHTPKTAVLGVNNKTYYNSAKSSLQSMLYFSLLVLVTFAYLSIRLIRKREYIFQVFNSYTFKEKLVAFRMFLL